MIETFIIVLNLHIDMAQTTESMETVYGTDENEHDHINPLPLGAAVTAFAGFMVFVNGIINYPVEPYEFVGGATATQEPSSIGVPSSAGFSEPMLAVVLTGIALMAVGVVVMYQYEH